MQKLNATNVVRLKEVIDTETQDKLILVIDYCARGEIIDWNPETSKFSPKIEGLAEFSEA